MNSFSDFKKPINFISILLGVIGIVLSIIFYLWSERHKQISYLQNGSTSIIFDSKRSSPSIKIYELDSTPITKNVYLFTGTIWNSGDFSIQKDDIRIPIHIKLNKDAKILDYNIVKQKDSTFSAFELKKINQNSILLNWNFFDPGNGIKFQIIYQDESESNITLNGKIAGINYFQLVKEDQLVKSNLWTWSTLSTFLLTILMILISVYTKEGIGLKVLYSLMAVILFIILFIKIYNYFRYLHLTPEI